MKSKKCVLIIATILAICLAVIWAGVSWFNYQFSSDGEEIPYVGGALFYSSENFYFTTPYLENLASEGAIRFYNNRLHIQAELDVPKSVFEELASEYNARITSYNRGNLFGDRYTFTFNRIFTYEQLQELAEEFEKLDFVRGANIGIVHSMNPGNTSLPSGSRWRNNWGLEAISTPSAWEHRGRMAPINVLILDAGFYRNHEDLDFMVSLGEHVSHKADSHGTHVAGIIGAEFDRGRVVSGIAPNSFMYGVRVAYMDEEQLMKIIQWYVREHGVRVINFSMAYNLIEFAAYRGNDNADRVLSSFSEDIEEIFLELINESHEFVFVTGAGNQHEKDYRRVVSNEYRYVADNNPSNQFGFRQDNNGTLSGISGVFCPFVRIQNEEVRSRIISVGAVDEEYNLANFSQRGNGLDVNAPGVNIYSTYNVTRRWYENWGREVSHYRRLSGTSMSTPFVSGLATMLFGINPSFTGEEVRQIIIGTADEHNHNMVNAEASVRMAMEWDNVGQTAGAGVGVEVATIREAYMEFMRQRGFERYIDDQDGQHRPTMYAIIDINGDGIPVLIISGRDTFGWHMDWIFSYDVAGRRIVYVSSIYYFGSLHYSQQHRALVYVPVRSHVGAGVILFTTLDDLNNDSISFTLTFDDGSTSGDVHYTITYGSLAEVSASRNINEIELRQHLDELIEIEFSLIPLSTQTRTELERETLEWLLQRPYGDDVYTWWSSPSSNRTDEYSVQLTFFDNGTVRYHKFISTGPNHFEEIENRITEFSLYEDRLIFDNMVFRVSRLTTPHYLAEIFLECIDEINDCNMICGWYALFVRLG